MIFRKKTEVEKPQEIYCQTCDRDLTGPKPLVIAEAQRSVYCIGYRGENSGSGGRCVDRAAVGGPVLYLEGYDISKWSIGSSPPKDISPDWSTKAEEAINWAIDNRVLVNFGSLEKSAQNNSFQIL